jgi:hypothetical protein
MDVVPWFTLLLLGAYHGLNPGMGWLFAVALGLQEHRRGAVLRALGPIALGHAASVALVLGVVGVIGLFVPIRWVQWLCAATLVGFGLYKLLAPMSHPRWVGMRVGGRDLVTWSFIMATAHGAGLMLLPLLVRNGGGEASAEGEHAHHDHAEHLQMMAETSGEPGSLPVTEVASVLVHTGAMFLVMGVIALVVFERLGLSLLRRRWFNVDRIWATVLIGTGLVALVV